MGAGLGVGAVALGVNPVTGGQNAPSLRVDAPDQDQGVIDPDLEEEDNI